MVLFGGKLFGGNIKKKHLAGTFSKTFGGNIFESRILAGNICGNTDKMKFLFFQNSTKFCFFKIKVQKLIPKSPLSLFCPICFNIAYYV